MTDLDKARIEVVRRHMALEITHDWDGVIATFEHPRYELLGPGTIFDGEAAVRSYFAASREPFPDQANEVISIAADADAYVDIALGLAADVTALDAIRQEMRPRMEASPLMDAERFAGHFADALRGMWRDWCAQG